MSVGLEELELLFGRTALSEVGVTFCGFSMGKLICWVLRCGLGDFCAILKLFFYAFFVRRRQVGGLFQHFCWVLEATGVSQGFELCKFHIGSRRRTHKSVPLSFRE